MLDDTSKMILEFMINNDKEHSDVTIASGLELDLDVVNNSLDNLLELECVKIVRKYIDCTIYKLTNKGRHYFKTQKIECFDKYIFPIILSLLSYILGLISGLLIG